MALKFDIKQRRVIPNWRDFKRTMRLGELSNSVSTQRPDISVLRPINDWQQNRNIGTAADLVNSAFISGKTEFPELNEAISYIIGNKDQSSRSLFELATSISEGTRQTPKNDNINQSKLIDLEVEDFDDFKIHLENNTIYKIINKTKNKITTQPYNSILWVELARLYSFLGNESKAEKAMTVALGLSPNNRFVLRSATRMFIHFDNLDKALYYLRKSDATRFDPWLISAHIATSSLMKRFSPLIKNGISIINSKKFSEYDLTELASSIGTLELSEGRLKKSRELLELSLKSPNDNSLAQLEWLARIEKKIQFNLHDFRGRVSNTFEAFTLENFQGENWKESLGNSIKWFLDIPYSKRPVLFGSFVASVFLKDYDTAVLLCESGLNANPLDPSILNNLVYALASQNNIEKATYYSEMFNKVKLNQYPDSEKIMQLATLGLVHFRSNNIPMGKSLYEQAIEKARIIKDDYLRDLAIVNYTKELILINDSEKDTFVQMSDNISESGRKDLVFFKNEIKDLIKKIEK
ncbi:MAG: hypothetical protein J7623_27410 [Chitinophaga sp.]|uniref:hypothetical protein n=1 Tax=Chitinophaga sp. TaxID=1869181 RepID=UPI001B096D36|nr:hypothetical protein [Chitinophaga sp.]MBO9732400.1 hypothetical protein [Chitinophaga sp.]